MTNHPNRGRAWTQSNTEGFTDAELALINEALPRIHAARPGVERSNVDDAVNNAWGCQETADELVADVLKRL